MDWFTAWSNSEMSSRSSPYTPASTINQPHHPVCAIRVFPEWESCVSSLVCLCHGSVYCASVPAMPEVCQHARGSSLKCLCFPGRFLEVPAVLDVLKAKTLCHCARWLKIHKTVLMAQIYLLVMILVCFSLSCDGLLAVFVTINCLQSKTILRLGFVMEDNMISLCFGIFIIVHSWII